MLNVEVARLGKWFVTVSDDRFLTYDVVFGSPEDRSSWCSILECSTPKLATELAETLNRLDVGPDAASNTTLADWQVARLIEARKRAQREEMKDLRESVDSVPVGLKE